MKDFLSLAERHRDDIFAAEAYIWAHPETGFHEFGTSSYLAAQFEKAGYTLKKAGDIPGFYTDVETGRPGPKLLILAELDALVAPAHPAAVGGCAHACGHNAQCAALLGIALCLREPGALDGLSGSIRLMAVPAEELIEVEFRDELRRAGKIRYLGGKAEFLRRGYLDGVDLAYLFHTGTMTDCLVGCDLGANGCMTKSIVYHGRAAHAGGSPEFGINALYAASLGLQSVNALRETFRDDEHVRVHPILTEGGTAVSIIPAEARLSTYVRGATVDSIRETNRKVNRALAAGALALGATVSVSDRPGYAPLRNSPELMDVAQRCMEELVGKDQVKFGPTWSCGSTDMGDLSCLMPVFHPHIAGASGHGHGDDYRLTNPEHACVLSAAAQLTLAARLLENGAAEARRVVSAYHPLYRTKEDYFEVLDRTICDRELVTYEKDGTAKIAF